MLSKSSFLRGVQCLKSLYLHINHPGLKDPLSESQQAVFDTGHNVGELARKLFPCGVLAAKNLPKDFAESIKLTERLIKADTPIIYEAGFICDRLTCFVDILVRETNGYHIYEVKSSTGITETNIMDAAFQYYLLSKIGLDIGDVSLVYLNNQYIRSGDLDIHQLFTIEPVLERVKLVLPALKTHLKDQFSILKRKRVPHIGIGKYCKNPYPCDFKGHCWRQVPGYSVFNISKLNEDSKFELYGNGIIYTTDIPDDYPLNTNQAIQVQADKTGEIIVDTEALRDFLNNLNYPLYFLDFETFQAAVPLYDQSRPYQQMVFQYSLHYLPKPGGRLSHREFLAQPGDDPRLQVIPQLLHDLETKGDIVVYNQSFEKSRLSEAARDFPKYEKTIAKVIPRLKDLMTPFQQKLYYTPAMKGSYSIKQVLPALVPGLSYAGLGISDGGMASLAFLKLMSETDPTMIEQVRNNLLEYCKQDTLAMVEILKVLEGVV